MNKEGWKPEFSNNTLLSKCVKIYNEGFLFRFYVWRRWRA